MSPTRLYLLKDTKQDLYVDLKRPLPQHQIDGIRFLYRQFKKKRSGVILNDPSGYGKCLQAALFLNAVWPSLNKPIFIMCEESDMDNWKTHFLKWTNFDELAINTTNPFAKNPIFINTVKDAQTFYRRNWSVVIVHDSSFSKEVMKTVFKADFKIWLTSVDMKEKLDIFSMIYEWFDTSNTVDIKDFIAKKKSPKDLIAKSLLLDAFLEDVVLRRNDFLTPFKKSGDEISRKHKLTVIEESPRKVSRKNKDPTGMKVKRSRKRIIEDDEPEHIPSNKENANEIIITNRNNDELDEFVFINNELPSANNSDQNKDSNKMDVESFIRDQKPLDSDGFKEFITDCDTTSQKSENEILNTDPNALCNFQNAVNESRPEDSNTLYNFQNAINEIVDNENKAQEDSNSQSIINNDSDVDTALKVEEDTDDSQDSFTINKRRNIKSKENVIIPETEDSVKLTEEIDNNKEDDVTIKDNNSNDSNGHKTPDVKIEESAEESDVKKSVKENKNIASAHKDINDKISDLEEQALKKFKGSFLDSIF